MIAPDQLRRFREDLTAVVGGSPATLGIAVSGGPDSMALLVLASAAAPGAVIGATVDHRLRPESGAEAEMVAQWCADAGVPHTTLTPPPGWSPRSLQADARQLRYALLGDWAIGAGCGALLTAHHADDQAETFLMRAARGSGVAGLGGIRSRWLWQRHRWLSGVSPDDHIADDASITVARPLLGWRRSDLAQVIAATQTPVVIDSSNADERYDRVRMRRLLADHGQVDAVGIARAAAACAEADAALAAMIGMLRVERLRDSEGAMRRYDVAGLPRELRRRLARDAILHVRDANGINEGSFSDATNVEALLDALDTGGQATLAGVVACARGDEWTFAAAPPRRST